MNFSNLTQRETGAAFGVTNKTIQRWTDTGCPRNDDKTYNLKNVIDWKLNLEKAKGQNLDDESKKHLSNWRKEKAALAALERRRLDHELIEVKQVQTIMYNHGQQTRQTLESMPVRVAALVAAENDQFSCQRLLEDEVYHSLITLCEWLRVHPEALEQDNQIEAQLDCILIALKDRKLDPIEYIQNHIENNSLAYIEEQKKK